MSIADDRVWSRARADANGIPWDRRRGRLLTPVTRGRYVHIDDFGDRDSRLAAVLDAVPAAALSHWTAADVWGAPVPSSRLCAVHVSVPTGTNRPRRKGIVAHHAVDLPVVLRDGLRLTHPARTWLDLATAGATLTDLVVVGDAFGQLGLAGPEQLSVLQLGRRRGASRLRRALELVDPRAESGPETRVRLLLLRAGLPTPSINHVVRDPLSGSFVARVDLAWPESMLAVEYDGDLHREPARWQRDLRRREALERLGWSVVVLTAADLRGPASAVVARVASRLSAATTQTSATQAFARGA